MVTSTACNGLFLLPNFQMILPEILQYRVMILKVYNIILEIGIEATDDDDGDRRVLCG